MYTRVSTRKKQWQSLSHITLGLVIHLLVHSMHIKSSSNDLLLTYLVLGTLRPFPQTPKRVIPPHIKRPDYADHPEGHPLGEQSARGSSYIKALSDEEKEGMKVVCKVSIFFFYFKFFINLFCSSLEGKFWKKQLMQWL